MPKKSLKSSPARKARLPSSPAQLVSGGVMCRLHCRVERQKSSMSSSSESSSVSSEEEEYSHHAELCTPAASAQLPLAPRALFFRGGAAGELGAAAARPRLRPRAGALGAVALGSGAGGASGVRGVEAGGAGIGTGVAGGDGGGEGGGVGGGEGGTGGASGGGGAFCG